MASYEPLEPFDDDDALEDDDIDGDPNPDRPVAEWLQDIGPEDMDRDEVMEELEASGFDLVDDDEYDLTPGFPSDQSDWSDELAAPTPMEAALNAENQRFAEQRPVEDQAIEELEAQERLHDER